MSVSVVIADDHGVVVEGLSLLVSTTGRYEVVATAANGRDAVQVILETRPDIAIIDLRMPELDGIEVTRRVRRDNEVTKILILSMVSDTQSVRSALAAGANGYLSKESSGAELLEALQAVLDGHRFLSLLIRDAILDLSISSSPDSTQSPLEQLSARERQILPYVVEGLTSAEIGRELGLSASTVATYRSRMMQKLDAPTIADLVRLAHREGIISS